MDSFKRDLRDALRVVVRERGTTLLVTLTLALGIGANTAIFSALRGSLLSDLPYRDASELVMLWLDNERLGIRTDITSYPNFADTREQATMLEDLGVYSPRWVTLSEGEPERVRASAVGANVFSILGATPARGRAFESREDLEGQESTDYRGVCSATDLQTGRICGVLREQGDPLCHPVDTLSAAGASARG